ncbi:MAG: hypothetical protein EA393_08065 [Bacteroidetes bacterium]|nr:MAG: hypothetical protein EA393_08065 [Bacteroidota bacterium]
MKSELSGSKVFYKTLVILSFILFIASLLFKYFAPEFLITEQLLYLAPFFLFMSILTYVLQNRTSGNDTKKALTFYLGISGIKLFLYMIILVFYGFFNRADATAFFISFFIYYLTYTFFEVKHQLKELSQ